MTQKLQCRQSDSQHIQCFSHNLNKLQLQLFGIELIEFLLRVESSRNVSRHDTRSNASMRRSTAEL
jgi:hypothetical protein